MRSLKRLAVWSVLAFHDELAHGYHQPIRRWLLGCFGIQERLEQRARLPGVAIGSFVFGLLALEVFQIGLGIKRG
jgi:hypothetical protein